MPAFHTVILTAPACQEKPYAQSTSPPRAISDRARADSRRWAAYNGNGESPPATVKDKGRHKDSVQIVDKVADSAAAPLAYGWNTPIRQAIFLPD